jgi:hypothetical protein
MLLDLPLKIAAKVHSAGKAFMSMARRMGREGPKGRPVPLISEFTYFVFVAVDLDFAALGSWYVHPFG